jgi:hypothetical protein
MSYGIRVTDILGNSCKMTSDIGTIISSGRVTMPSGLVDTNKYYTTINLPDTIPVSSLAVFATPVKWTSRTIRQTGEEYFGYAIQVSFLDDDYTYYTKDISTGILTPHTAGNRTLSNQSTWHQSITAFPLVYWEQLGATSVSSIKIFAATCYCTNISTNTGYNPTDTFPTNSFVYSLYTDGVETIDYTIIAKKYNY